MPVYLSHATGFCGGVWSPIRDRLESQETEAWDFPGHGSGPKLEPPFTWQTFGEFVLDVTESGGIGVGHSMGAAALVMAQIADPKRFRALVLVEPIVFPPPHQRVDHPLAAVARKRKTVFETREAAYENFVNRPAFAGWDPQALNGYVNCGFAGPGPVLIACDPEVEAEVYNMSAEHDTWELLSQVEVPVLVLSGAETDTIKPDLARAQAAQFVRGGFEVVPDAGHFLPMENPALVAQRVERMVAAVGMV